jgi:hypothetical protein
MGRRLVLLLIVPLILLAALGVRGVMAGRRNALESARAEARRVVEDASGRADAEFDAVRKSARRVSLYPEIPQPTKNQQVEALYTRALAEPRGETENLLAGLLAEYPDATSPGGVPLGSVIAWTRLVRRRITSSSPIAWRFSVELSWRNIRRSSPLSFSPARKHLLKSGALPRMRSRSGVSSGLRTKQCAASPTRKVRAPVSDTAHWVATEPRSTVDRTR